MSIIRGRAENAKLPDALAYYQRLERESKRIYSVSAYDQSIGSAVVRPRPPSRAAVSSA